MADMTDREEFEAAYARQYPFGSRIDGKFAQDRYGDYEDVLVQVGRTMWDAARASQVSQPSSPQVADSMPTDAGKVPEEYAAIHAMLASGTGGFLDADKHPECHAPTTPAAGNQQSSNPPTEQRQERKPPECQAKPGEWSQCQLRTIEAYNVLQPPKYLFTTSTEQTAGKDANSLVEQYLRNKLGAVEADNVGKMQFHVLAQLAEFVLQSTADSKDAELRIPEGWALYTADFSCIATGVKLSGRVMLTRTGAARKAWFSLPEDVRESEEGPPLFVCETGSSFDEALKAAIRAAQQAKGVQG